MDGKIMRAGFYLLLVLALLSQSCNELIIVLDEVPSNTPSNAKIFVASDLNYMDPGNRSYSFQMDSVSGKYTYAFPKGVGKIKFRFTRGDWTTVEADKCGNPIEWRMGSLQNDTIHLSIDSWTDLGPTNCPAVTFILDEVPEGTASEDIFLTGNFNNWFPAEAEYKLLKQDSIYTYTLTPDTVVENMEYKFTRGSWESVEVNAQGLEFPIRTFKYGYVDTIRTTIPGWSDQVAGELQFVTFLVINVPQNTPEPSTLHMVGSFNSWYPRDNSLILTRLENNTYVIRVPQREGSMQYKFTRGSWATVEGNSDGSRRANRVYDFGSQDTVFVEIASWEDLNSPTGNSAK